MKKKNNENLIIAGVGAAALGIFMLSRKKNTTFETFPTDVPTSQPTTSTPKPTTSTPKPAAPVVLNKALVLKKGSSGNEVRELQRLLGIAQDGSFGPNTEAALLKKKGVKEISLNGFATAPNMNPNPLAVGNRVMANLKAGVKVYKAQLLANNTYSYTTNLYDTVPYGTEIGKIIMLSSPTKTSYVVKMTGTFSDQMVFVNATDVVKI